MKLALPFSLIVCVNAVAAEPFSSELTFSHFNNNYQNYGFSSNNLGYRYYLSGNSTEQNLPYAALQQFGRRSSVAINYLHSDLDSTLWYAPQSFSAWNIGGIYQSTEHDWYFSLEHLRLSKFSSHKTSSSAGYFIQPGWLVKLHLQNEKVESRDSYWHYGVSSEKIWAFDSGSFLNFSASYFNNEGPRSDSLALALDYYFNPALSMGVFINDNMSEDYLVSSDRAGIRSSWFVTPQLQLKAGIGLEDAADSEYAWDLGINWRF
ncbi:putative porin [Rheinheimera pleomorphica]|uniref:putative porin n=1 Tax=Rheinheimera pleomorphica TaxID=2703963 RepID=UPI00141EE887|nr:putative porin [Rheinheimera pleomorphica]